MRLILKEKELIKSLKRDIYFMKQMIAFMFVSMSFAILSTFLEPNIMGSLVLLTGLITLLSLRKTLRKGQTQLEKLTEVNENGLN